MSKGSFRFTLFETHTGRQVSKQTGRHRAYEHPLQQKGPEHVGGSELRKTMLEQAALLLWTLSSIAAVHIHSRVVGQPARACPHEQHLDPYF